MRMAAKLGARVGSIDYEDYYIIEIYMEDHKTGRMELSFTLQCSESYYYRLEDALAVYREIVDRINSNL